MTYYILQRKGKFLNDMYQWGDIPHPFPEWQFTAVLPMAMQFKDRPQQIGEVMADGTVKFTDVLQIFYGIGA